MITLHTQHSEPPLHRPTTMVENARIHLEFLKSCQPSGVHSQDDSIAGEAWISLFGEALSNHKRLPDPFAGHVLSTGATALHVLACMAKANGGHDEIVSDWLDRVGPDRSGAMGSRADCSGRAPFGIALAADLEVTGFYSAGQFGGALRALAERGLVGAPGEAGSVLLESMARQGARLNSTGALRLLPLHKVIEACSRHGVDWLAPLSTPNGLVEDRGAAIGAIMDKLDNLVMKPDLRAGLEALLLGDQIRKVGKRSASHPRL